MIEPLRLYEDNHLLVVSKPAGLLSQGDRTGDPDLTTWARDDLKRRYNKPGGVFVGLTHRLDRPVSGLVILARTGKAAARLAQQFRAGTIRKRYVAVLESSPNASFRFEESGILEDYLLKLSDSNRSCVLGESRGRAESGTRQAVSSYMVLERWRHYLLILLEPVTGRFHQLRAQTASRGWPIAGDVKYGASRVLRAVDGYGRIALHSWQVEFEHPTRRERMRLSAPKPSDWPAGWPFPDDEAASQTKARRTSDHAAPLCPRTAPRFPDTPPDANADANGSPIGFG